MVFDDTSSLTTLRNNGGKLNLNDLILVWLAVFLLSWLGSSTFLVYKNKWKFDAHGVGFIGLITFFWPLIPIVAMLVITLVILLVVVYGIPFILKEAKSGH